jgi:hypothetical protein
LLWRLTLSDKIKRFSAGKLPVFTIIALFAASVWGIGSPSLAQKKPPEEEKKIEKKLQKRPPIPDAQRELMKKRLEALNNRKNNKTGLTTATGQKNGKERPLKPLRHAPAQKRKQPIPSENLLKEKEEAKKKAQNNQNNQNNRNNQNNKNTKNKQNKKAPPKEQPKKKPADNTAVKTTNLPKAETDIKVASIIKSSQLETFKPKFSIKRDIFSPDLMAPPLPSSQMPPPPPKPVVVETPEELPEDTEPLQSDIENETRNTVFYEGYVIKHTKNFALISASGEFYAVGVGDTVLEKVKIIKIEKKAITVEVNSTVFEIQLKGDDDQ